MTANELRIGNYVYFKHCDYDINIPRKINYTKNPNIVGLEGIFQNQIEYNNIIGIPLSKELLLKCGFYTSDWDDNTSFRLQISDYYTLVVNLEFDTYELGDLDIRKIYYLHELQNLYFVLTGKELKINI